MPKHQIEYKLSNHLSEYELNTPSRELSMQNKTFWNSLSDAAKRRWDDDYCCYHCDLHKYEVKTLLNKAMPFALVIESCNGFEPKFKFHKNLNEPCPAQHFPRYLLTALVNKESEWSSTLRFGLVPLGQFGLKLNRVFLLKQETESPLCSIFNSKETSLDFLLFDSNSVCTVSLNQESVGKSRFQKREINYLGYVIPMSEKDSSKEFLGFDRSMFKLIVRCDDRVSEFLQIDVEDSLILVNQLDQSIYVMEEQVHKVIKISEEGEHTTEIVQFSNYSQLSKMIDECEPIAFCRLTESKHLVLVLQEIGALTFQDLFNQSMIWFLIDLENLSTEIVNPIVYPLGKQVNDDGFKTVRKRKIDFRFQDGDLNGGLVADEPMEIPNDLQISNPKLFAFRPFHENPDLFQVQLTLNGVVESKLMTTNSFGYSFRLFFRIKSQAITHYFKLSAKTIRSTFSDVSLHTFR